jgi:hypothetical protein
MVFIRLTAIFRIVPASQSAGKSPLSPRRDSAFVQKKSLRPIWCDMEFIFLIWKGKTQFSSIRKKLICSICLKANHPSSSQMRHLENAHPRSSDQSTSIGLATILEIRLASSFSSRFRLAIRAYGRLEGFRPPRRTFLKELTGFGELSVI